MLTSCEGRIIFQRAFAEILSLPVGDEWKSLSEFVVISVVLDPVIVSLSLERTSNRGADKSFLLSE